MLLRVQIIFLFVFVTACSAPSNQEDKAKEELQEEAIAEQVKHKADKTILFFGNSITAGYQLDMGDAFPAIIQRKIDSIGLDYLVVNAGLSGETSAGGLGRINWVLRTVPDIFFLELGGNDGLRGLPLSETYDNLQAIIDQVKKENPEVLVIIAGMMVPPNLGQDYASEFSKLFPRLAEENNAAFIPFLLEGVAGEPELNLSDGIHPTPKGHEIVAETVWNYLQPML